MTKNVLTATLRIPQSDCLNEYCSRKSDLGISQRFSTFIPRICQSGKCFFNCYMYTEFLLYRGNYCIASSDYHMNFF